MNVILNWVLPTTRESGKSLAVADIAHVAVEVSADEGASWSSVGAFTPETLSTQLTDLDFGVWAFRGFVVDTKGRASKPLFAALTVEDATPPSVLLSLEAVPA